MQQLQPNEPFYQISQAAKLLGITSDRLRTYEEEGLIKLYRTKHSKDGKRLFSPNDIEWLTMIRDLIKLGVSIPTIRILLIAKFSANSTILKEKDLEIDRLNKELEHYKKMDATINRAVVIAEEAASKYKVSSLNESDAIVTEAKKNANRIINDALMKAEQYENDAARLRRNIIAYKRRMKNLIDQQSEIIDDLDKIDME